MKSTSNPLPTGPSSTTLVSRIAQQRHSLTPYLRRNVVAHIEMRTPPTPLTQEYDEYRVRRYDESVARGEDNLFVKERRLLYPMRADAARKEVDKTLLFFEDQPDYPDRFIENSLAKQNDLKYTLRFVDTEENPIVDQMLKLKRAAKKKGRLSYDYFVVNPFPIDMRSVLEKSITYFLNTEHKGKFIKMKRGEEIRTSDGSGKSIIFIKCTPFRRDNAESINDLYNWIVEELFDYQETLFEVRFTDYGIQNTYISAFMSIDSDGDEHLMFMKHTWQSSFQFLSKKDIQVLTEKNLLPPNFSPDEPPRDGWGKLITNFILPFQNLSPDERDFAKRKYLNKDSSVKEVVTPFADQYEQELNNWQIKNEETLSRCAEDWTNAKHP